MPEGAGLGIDSGVLGKGVCMTEKEGDRVHGCCSNEDLSMRFFIHKPR